MIKKTHTAKIVITIFLILIAAILAGVAGAIIYQKKQEEEVKIAAYEKLMSVQLSNPDMPEQEYRKYKSENPDVYAWLHIVDTEISCPIVQSSVDNTYYLDHDAFGKESKGGAVFTENYNSLTFEDPDTVLYGNSGMADSVFASLLEYEDPAYFENHRDIKIYLPDRSLNYYIFATYTGDDRHLLLSQELDTEEGFKKYIKEIFRLRGLKTNVDKQCKITADDKLLTLSTGHPSSENARFLIQSVLIE